MKDPIKISLILSTYGRVDCLNLLFDSLVKQTFKHFEVIVVDQNNDNRIEEIVYKYSKCINLIVVKHLPGLSSSRNFGVKLAHGDILGFPDDDCFYSDDMLKYVILEFLKHQDLSLLSVKMQNSIKSGRKIQEGLKRQLINKKNVFKLCSSISTFVKKDEYFKVGGFDEKLGLGGKSNFKSCEDYDFVFKILENRRCCLFVNNFVVYHPWDDSKVKNNSVHSYWTGGSEMLLFNRYKFGYYEKIKHILRRFMICCYFAVCLNKNKFVNSVSVLIGNIRFFNLRSI